MRKRIAGQQKYLSLTAAEARTLAANAPNGTVFKTRLRLTLSRELESGGRDGKAAETDLTITREDFMNAADRLLDCETEAEGFRIPVSTVEWENGEVIYWIA